MALICNDCRVEGKARKIICKSTEAPCLFVRFCAVSGKYYQTDAAAKCKLRGENDGKKNQADALDRITV